MPDDKEAHRQRLRELRVRREEWQLDYEYEESEVVAAARQGGLSWEDIASALGRRRSSVWEKYHD